MSGTKMIQVLKKSVILMIYLSLSSLLFASENLLNQAHAIYKLPSEKITDLLIQLVNTDVFTKRNTQYTGEVILSLAPINKGNNFDCQRFWEAIGDKKQKIVQEKMNNYLFQCNDGKYTEKQALDRFYNVLKPTINQPHEIDATWAWFSSTGNVEALKRLIENYLHNKNACKRCIEWSYSSNYRQNKDVYRYLKYFSMTVRGKEKVKLLRLAPRVDTNKK